MFVAILLFLWHLITRFKYIDTINRTTDDHIIINWMESYLFYLLLSLMKEH